LERLTPDQIERLRNTSKKQFLEYANYYYVHDIDYYKLHFEPHIIQDKKIAEDTKKSNTKTVWTLSLLGIGLFFLVAIVVVVTSIFEKEEKPVLIEKTVNSEADYNNSKAKKQCMIYLAASLNDPSSYEPISWSDLTKTEGGNYELIHRYRAKNKFGALILGDTEFLLNKNMEVISAREK